MSEYLFPIPGSVLRKLLDFKAKSGEQFSEKEAISDIMLALDRNDVKPERYLAKRWSWSASKVHRWKQQLMDTALNWRKFNHNTLPVEVKQSEARAKQSEAQIGLGSVKKGASEAEAKQSEARAKQYRTDTYTDTDIKNLNNLTTPANSKPDNSFLPDSWQYEFSLAHLEALKRLGIAPKSATRDEEKTLREGAEIFDKINRLDGYSEQDIMSTMQWLLTPENWWIESGNYASVKKLRKAKDGQKFFERILIQARNENGTTSTDRRDDEAGRIVQDTRTGSGNEMQKSIRPRKGASTSRPKRPGEYSRLEWLREAGYSDAEIYGDANDPTSAGLLASGTGSI